MNYTHKKFKTQFYLPIFKLFLIPFVILILFSTIAIADEVNEDVTWQIKLDVNKKTVEKAEQIEIELRVTARTGTLHEGTAVLNLPGNWLLQTGVSPVSLDDVVGTEIVKWEVNVFDTYDPTTISVDVTGYNADETRSKSIDINCKNCLELDIPEDVKKAREAKSAQELLDLYNAENKVEEAVEELVEIVVEEIVVEVVEETGDVNSSDDEWSVGVEIVADTDLNSNENLTLNETKTGEEDSENLFSKIGEWFSSGWDFVTELIWGLEDSESSDLSDLINSSEINSNLTQESVNGTNAQPKFESDAGVEVEKVEKKPNPIIEFFTSPAVTNVFTSIFQNEYVKRALVLIGTVLFGLAGYWLFRRVRKYQTQ